MIAIQERQSIKTMLPVQFEGSEQELRSYIKKHHFVSSRIILLADNTQEIKKSSGNWKEKWKKIAGMWSDYHSVQDDFLSIRASFNNRIPQ